MVLYNLVVWIYRVLGYYC